MKLLKFISLALLIAGLMIALAFSRRQVADLTDARAKDAANFKKAEAKAKALNDAQIARIIEQRNASDERVVHEARENIIIYRDLSARGQLRPSFTADQGRAGSAKTSLGVEAPCRAIDPAWVCVAPEIVLRSAENEERHDRLIDAVEGQAAIDPNAP